MPDTNGHSSEPEQQNQKPMWSMPSSQSNAPKWSPPASVPASTFEPANKPSTRKIATAFAVGVAVCALAVWGFVALRSTNSTNAPVVADLGTQDSSQTVPSNNTASVNESSGTAARPSASAAGGLQITSPQPAGLQVAVSRVDASQPTWVVIYENHNGTPGNALGAALFMSSRQSGPVDLLRGTLPGTSYLAGMALDDGDRIFSLQNDKPVRDAQGNPVLVTFQTD